jgi:hypothetical protein
MKKIYLLFVIATFQWSLFAQVEHSKWNTILLNHVSDQGNVNYKAIIENSKALNDYLELLSKNHPSSNWSKLETLAYWINAYNAFTVKLIIDHYPVSSIKDIKNAWDLNFIKIGDKDYSLNYIEHEIIRKMDEPRIHFALVCAAISCPKLYNQAFTASTLEADLSKLTKEFLRDSSKNTLTEKHVKLSKIFQWFKKDFEQNGGSVIDFLNSYSEVCISPKAKKSFYKYDWRLNE